MRAVTVATAYFSTWKQNVWWLCPAVISEIASVTIKIDGQFIGNWMVRWLTMARHLQVWSSFNFLANLGLHSEFWLTHAESARESIVHHLLVSFVFNLRPQWRIKKYDGAEIISSLVTVNNHQSYLTRLCESVCTSFFCVENKHE